MSEKYIDNLVGKAEKPDKYARCPFCSAVFHISEDKLLACKGDVRCGNCRKIFNANDHAVVEGEGGNFHSQIAVEELRQSGSSISDQITTPNFDSPVVDKNDQDQAAESFDTEINASRIIAEMEEIKADLEPEIGFEVSLDVSSDADSDPGPDSGLEPGPEVITEDNTESLDEKSIELAVLNTYMDDQLNDSDPELSEPNIKLPADSAIGNWFNAEPDSLLNKNPFLITPSQSISADAKPSININGVDDYIVDRPNPIMSVFWFFVCLGFVLLMGLQIKHYYVEKYAQDEKYRPALSMFCKVANCVLPARRDPFRFTITNTRIDLHPQEPGALRITVRLLNQAEFAQQYPDLQLTLTDRVGRVVGRRTFAPDSYLRQEQVNNLMPGDLGSIEFDLSHPHEKAVGFVVDIVRES